MNLPNSAETIDLLQQLQKERKFIAERFYPGAPTEEIRSVCERRVNNFLSDLSSVLLAGTCREEVFARAKALTKAFSREDTEEREKVDDYIGEAMRAIGLDDWTKHI